MNFVRQWSVQHNSDLLFWEIAIPIMLVITPMFMRSDIQKAYHFVQKKMISKKAVQVRSSLVFGLRNVGGLRCIAWNRCISSLEDILLYSH